MFSDVRDLTTRNAVEGVQANPNGKLFYDASAGSAFYPNNSASKLVAAVAWVKAAGLENETSTTFLLSSIPDANSIPSQYRNYVAVALNHGFITLENGRINPYRSITRLDAVIAFNRILGN
jgi:hypothetical protein